MLMRHFFRVLCLKAQTLAYVEYFGQFTSDSEQFPEDVAQVLYLLAQFTTFCGKSLSSVLTFRPFFLLVCSSSKVTIHRKKNAW
jgi:hypothetical protein